MLRFMKRRDPDWWAHGTSGAGRVIVGRAADPNVCPNCGRAVNAEDEVGSRSIGDQPSEIARCNTSDCAASLARVVRTDGSRGAWSAVVATDGVAPLAYASVLSPEQSLKRDRACDQNVDTARVAQWLRVVGTTVQLDY
jgi:hypothetical protein